MIINNKPDPKIGDITTAKRYALLPTKLKDGRIIWLESYYKVWRYDLGWHRPTNYVRAYIEMWCYQGNVRKRDLKEFINNLPICNYHTTLPKILKK